MSPISTTPLRPGWKNSNKLDVFTGHKTFDRKARSISRGNVWGDAQTSSHVRAHSNTVMPSGDPCKAGRLQEFDFKIFPDMPAHVRRYIEAQSRDESLWLYEFFHYAKGAKTIHGYVATREHEGGVLAIIPTGPTRKSVDVLVWCARVLMSDEENQLPDLGFPAPGSTPLPIPPPPPSIVEVAFAQGMTPAGVALGE